MWTSPLKRYNWRGISWPCFFVCQYLIIWQAFEPPLDMSQDIDICENPHLEDAPNNHGFSGARGARSCHSTSTSARSCFSRTNQACCEEESDLCNSLGVVIANKVHSIVIPPFAFLIWMRIKVWFFPFMSFSFRNLTSVDNHRRWKMKVTVIPFLETRI